MVNGFYIRSVGRKAPRSRRGRGSRPLVEARFIRVAMKDQPEKPAGVRIKKYGMPILPQTAGSRPAAYLRLLPLRMKISMTLWKKS